MCWRRDRRLRTTKPRRTDAGLVQKERQSVLTKVVVSIVNFCTRFALPVVIVGVLLAIGSAYYSARNFSINTDVNKLISPDLDWRKRDIAFDKAFDQERLIITVVEAPTPEFANAAANALEKKLLTNRTDFDSVRRLDGGEFFEKNGLLFMPSKEVQGLTGQFQQAAPLLEIMAGDPSLRGLTGALETGLTGIRRGQIPLDNAAGTFNTIAATIEDVLKNGNGSFSWRGLVSDKPLTDSDKRGFIEVKPVLDFAALEPGKSATDAIRQAAVDLNLAGEYGARVRLTGPVPIA